MPTIIIAPPNSTDLYIYYVVFAHRISKYFQQQKFDAQDLKKMN